MLTSEKLEALQRLDSKLFLIRIELREAEAAFEAGLARAIESVGKPLRSTLICLRCGSAHPLDTACPNCPEG